MQSVRRKNRHSRWALVNAPDAVARRRQRRDAERLAMDAPIRQSDMPPGSPWGDITIRTPGWSLVVDLRTPLPTTRGKRPRSDQYLVVIDGRQVSPAMGLVALLAHVRGLWPRVLPRAQRVDG